MLCLHIIQGLETCEGTSSGIIPLVILFSGNRIFFFIIARKYNKL